jgi:polyferredoxin
VVFFSQLLLGIFVSEKFLMSGNLQLPLPFMIISGPIYRGEISVMTILFLGTVLISGPAWCSHLCYFGGLDNFISGNGRSSKKLKNKFKIKHSVLFIVILVRLVFRWIGVNSLVALSTAIVAGIAGFFIIGKYSRKTGKMVHCSL